TTVVETNIHHPTDSTLLGDGVRVLTRIMKKIRNIAGTAGTKLRDRTRSVKLRLLEIGRVARSKGPVRQDRLMQHYRRLLDATSRMVGQAKRFSEEIAQGVKRSRSFSKQLALKGLRRQLDDMMPRVKQVMKQTRARIFQGNTRSEDKLLSLFEPSTEVIRKGKAGKPNEFGKMVKVQEAENRVIAGRPSCHPKPNALLPPPESYASARCGPKPARPGDVKMGTDREPVPVTGLALNFSPNPRIAPPPLGIETAGARKGLLSSALKRLPAFVLPRSSATALLPK